MKNEPNEMISPSTNSSTANTTHLAVSIHSRRGTASSEARMTPVEYSVVITSTPSTQSVSWPRPSPAPRMKPTGSVATDTSRDAACGPLQSDAVSDVNSVVKPRVITTKMISVQNVDRTERILV